MYDLILFDLDGTLTLPETGITRSVQYALGFFGINEKNPDHLRRFIGPPLVDGFMEFYNMSQNDALTAVEKYRERFSKTGIFENELIEGVPSMLKELKKHGKKLVLATSKPAPYSAKIVKHFGIDKYFDFLSCSELDGTHNDKSEIIAEALKVAENCKFPVMVGDRKHDAIGAEKNSIPFIGVSYGYAADGELEAFNPAAIASDIHELQGILLK